MDSVHAIFLKCFSEKRRRCCQQASNRARKQPSEAERYEKNSASILPRRWRSGPEKEAGPGRSDGPALQGAHQRAVGSAVATGGSMRGEEGREGGREGMEEGEEVRGFGTEVFQTWWD